MDRLQMKRMIWKKHPVIDKKNAGVNSRMYGIKVTRYMIRR